MLHNGVLTHAVEPAPAMTRPTNCRTNCSRCSPGASWRANRNRLGQSDAPSGPGAGPKRSNRRSSWPGERQLPAEEAPTPRVLPAAISSFRPDTLDIGGKSPGVREAACSEEARGGVRHPAGERQTHLRHARRAFALSANRWSSRVTTDAAARIVVRAPPSQYDFTIAGVRLRTGKLNRINDLRVPLGNDGIGTAFAIYSHPRDTLHG